MTNYERIKNMSIDEMARFLCSNEQPCKRCAFKNKPCLCSDAIEVHLKWLEDEADEQKT